MFLEGHTYGGIAKYLTSEGIKTLTGKSKWNATVILRMLKNEKYVGNCISQKSYTSDFLTHNRKKNNGELAKYFKEGNHEAIVTKEVFIKVQEKIAENNENWNKIRGNKTIGTKFLLSNLFVCGKCGSPLRRYITKWIN